MSIFAREHPKYYDRSIRHSRDRFWTCPPDSFLHNIPIVIAYSGYSFWDANHSYQRANSDIFGIELVTSGDATVVQNGRRNTVKAGEAFILHRGQRHVFRTGPSGILRKRMVIMDGIMLEIVLQSLEISRHDVVRFKNPSRITSLLRESNRIIGTLEEGYLWRLSQLAYEILLEVGKNLIFEDQPPGVTLALDYMNRNLHRNLSLSEIAAKSGLSMYHFSRLFNKSTHCSPVTFFMRQKMALAKSLLRTTTLLIKEIASMIGFEDPLYFSAQFKKHEGISPRQYREQQTTKWLSPAEPE